MRHEVVVSAPAKVNLCLGVGPVRSDGFHPLATVYQAIGLYDQVTATAAASGEWTLEVTGHPRLAVADVPTDDRNLALRAARLLAEHHGLEASARLHVHKGIPVAGGLAGGSADAAATLLACDLLWDTHTPRGDLLALAGRLGSDVPFALTGGTALGSGRGEVVTPAMTRGSFWWVVVESPVGLSTPQVYAEFDRLHQGREVAQPEVPDVLMEALRSGDPARLGAALSNDLQEPALLLRPELAEVLECGLAASAHGALLSGSGPSCLFLAEGRGHADHLAAALDEAGFGPLSVAPGPVPGARPARAPW
ncbi:MAG TPA: 4-(cytidine 5'-diphospho)-2-C-methyl-D-erythritol kinase [Nocardioidaceae bacterium]|nr:4-(cytidine 5'-diphospho)-2-C-methyl-D-erythritol kinase [Nocardioidaceae bacterium]